MKRLPPLPALHTFWITAQCCNFTRAAEQLHITQGAVSRQIAGLEEHLGYPLFIRLARGLKLTAEGREWMLRVQQMFGLLGEAVEQIGVRRQTLQLKAPSCVMRWLLPRLLQWQKERPDVPVKLTASLQHGVDFQREQFDAAVIYGATPDNSPGALHLFDEQLTPVCSPLLLKGSPALKTPADLQQHGRHRFTQARQHLVEQRQAFGTVAVGFAAMHVQHGRTGVVAVHGFLNLLFHGDRDLTRKVRWYP